MNIYLDHFTQNWTNIGKRFFQKFRHGSPGKLGLNV